MNWGKHVATVSPYIVKIETPDAHGTGLCLRTTRSGDYVIVTARHVVEAEDKWQKPIRIYDHTVEKWKPVSDDDRVIFVETGLGSDSSFMIVSRDTKLDFPVTPFPFLPIKDVLPVGAEVGWAGFPKTSPNVLCFFSGVISAVVLHEGAPSYYIDGVAIHGVSGGPVFHRDSKGLKIVGIVSEYLYSVDDTGGRFPGMLVAAQIQVAQNAYERVDAEFGHLLFGQFLPAPRIGKARPGEDGPKEVAKPWREARRIMKRLPPERRAGYYGPEGW